MKCITAALKRTPIKDKEHAVKPLRSPKSKKVKRKLSLEDDDSHDSDDDNDRNTDDDRQQEAVEFHNCDSPRIPIYSRGKTVMSPLETTQILIDPDPLRVQKNAVFIIHMGSLDSQGDVKCDDVGSWRNNSNAKFPMAVPSEGGTPKTLVRALTKGETTDLEERKVTLKRECYRINRDLYNDFRKRIETIIGE